MANFINALPIIAGILNLCSVLPRIRALWNQPDLAASECPMRALLPVLANLTWVIYALALRLLLMTVMCSLGALLNAIILGFILRYLWHVARSRPTP